MGFFSSIVNAVSDVFSSVGDVAEKAVDVASNVVQGAIDDPLKAAALAAAAFGMPAAMAASADAVAAAAATEAATASTVAEVAAASGYGAAWETALASTPAAVGSGLAGLSGADVGTLYLGSLAGDAAAASTTFGAATAYGPAAYTAAIANSGWLGSAAEAAKTALNVKTLVDKTTGQRVTVPFNSPVPSGFVVENKSVQNPKNIGSNPMNNDYSIVPDNTSINPVIVFALLIGALYLAGKK